MDAKLLAINTALIGCLQVEERQICNLSDTKTLNKLNWRNIHSFKIQKKIQ